MKLEYSSSIMDDGAEIRYIDIGGGRPIVYLNGFGEAVANYNAMIEKLSHSFRCVFFDQRGFGLSPNTENVGVERSARDLQQLINQLDLQDVFLVGYSMGGSVAFSYMSQFGLERIGRLLLVDTSPKLLNDQEWLYGLWQGRYSYKDYICDLDSIVNNPSLFHLSFYARSTTRNLGKSLESFPKMEDVGLWLRFVSEKIGVRETLLKRVFCTQTSEDKCRIEAEYWRTMVLGDWRSTLSMIDIPTLCCFANPGSLYSPLTANYLVNHISKSGLIVIDDSDHTFPKAKYSEFSDYILAFGRTESPDDFLK